MLHCNKKKGGDNYMKKLLNFAGRTALICIVVFFVLFLLLIIGLTRLTGWQVHKLSPADKIRQANYAQVPDLADSLERYGTRGFQDVESQLETRAFKDVDTLCKALPDGYRPAIEKAISESTPTTEADVKGKEATAYQITASLPLNRDESKDTTYHRKTSYYVFIYKNGKCRFVIRNY